MTKVKQADEIVNELQAQIYTLVIQAREDIDGLNLKGEQLSTAIQAVEQFNI